MHRGSGRRITEHADVKGLCFKGNSLYRIAAAVIHSRKRLIPCADRRLYANRSGNNVIICPLIPAVIDVEFLTEHTVLYGIRILRVVKAQRIQLAGGADADRFRRLRLILVDRHRFCEMRIVVILRIRVVCGVFYRDLLVECIRLCGVDIIGVDDLF